MIDLNLLRQDPTGTAALINKKDPDFNTTQLIELDAQVRQLIIEVESLRSQKNDLAQKAKSGITPEIREQSIAVGKDLKDKEAALDDMQQKFDALYLTCPNLLLPGIPEGNKEENKVVREWGAKVEFNFPFKNHVELGELHNWFNFETATKTAASNFVWYEEEGARVIYALTRLMLKNNRAHGFKMMIPPYLANETTLTVSGNFPKFKEDVFTVAADGLYSIPTSEVSLVNKYRDTILATDELPIRMTSWTSCFRREAGNYGKMERGLIRIHQFEKVELVSLCTPENSEAELESMVACAESILQQLGLHYRVSLLAAQDCSFQSAKTYDIEVWLPGQNRYYEVSSASNCTDFQARRGKIRHRKQHGDKTELVHTLNASSLALPRLMVALMEVYQQPDGTIALPEVLVREML
jgi:seryl-tRNA synthetase